MKMKLLILLTLIFFAPFVVNAEELIMDWQTSWGGPGTDEAGSLQQTSDGGYITMVRSFATVIDENSSFDDQSNYEKLILKYDKDGKLMWEINWGGNGNDIYNFVITEDGELILFGSSDSTDIDGITNKGLEDAIIAKYSSDGTLLWQTSWGGDLDDRFENIKIQEDGSIIVFALSYSTNLDDDQVYGMSLSSQLKVLKYNKNGKLLFQKSLGGTSSFEPSVEVTDDGGYITRSYDANFRQIYLHKYDENFDLLWDKKIGDESNGFLPKLHSGSDGYFAYYIIDDENSENDGDLYLIKYDKNFNTVFENTLDFDIDINYDDISLGISSDVRNNEDFFVFGIGSRRVESNNFDSYGAMVSFITYEDSFILKYNKSGELLSKIIFDDNDSNLAKPAFLDNGDYIVRLESAKYDDNGYTNPDNTDLKFIYFDKNNDIKWEKSYKQKDMKSYGLKKDGTLTICLSTDSINIEGIESKGGIDSIILQYDKSGNLLFSTHFGGNGNDLMLSGFGTEENNMIYIYSTDSTDLNGLELDEGKNTVFVKYDKDLNIVWQMKYDNIYSYPSYRLSPSDRITFNVSQNKDGSFIFVGSSDSTDIDGITNKGGHDIVIRKYFIKYDLENLESKNGTFELEQNGQYGIINPTPTKGYEVDKVIVKDKEGNVLDVEVTELEDGTYSFKLYRDVSVEVTFKEKIENPKTGLINTLLVLVIGFAVSFTGFILVKKYNKQYEI